MSKHYQLVLFESFDFDTEDEKEIASIRNIHKTDNAKQLVEDEIQDEKDERRLDQIRSDKMDIAMDLMIKLNSNTSNIIDLFNSVDPEIIDLLYDHLNDIYVDDGNKLDLFNIDIIDAFNEIYNNPY
jgi:hypothetical protein